MKRITKYTVELVRESRKNYEIGTKICNSPESTVNVLNTVLNLEDSPSEKFIVLCLDSKLQVIGLHVVTQGTINQSLVSPREVFQRALLNNAQSIIIAHNHPSGNTNPSSADKRVTDLIKDAGELMEIRLIDHIIVGYNSYFSFKEKGII